MKYKAIILAFLLLMSLGFYDYYNVIYKPTTILKEEMVIEENQAFFEIRENILENIPLFDSSKNLFYFSIYTKLSGIDTKIKSGHYPLTNQKQSIADLFEKFSQGSTVKKEIRITSIEGWSLYKLDEYLKEQPFENTIELSSLKVKDFQQDYTFLQGIDPERTLEGFLFPDTYSFFVDSNNFTVAKKMLDNFDKKLTEQMRQEISEQSYSLDEIIILASIIENEVRTLESKKNVSSIFRKRLDIGMKLQSDATINYFTQSGRDRSLLTDLEIDNPYNSYLYQGLPPGPISNPGFDSIMAAIYPIENSYYYFLTDKNGEIYYANTFQGHIQNRNKYLK